MSFQGADQAKDKRQLEEIFVLSNASGNGLLSIPELQSVLELMGKKCQQHVVSSMVASVNTRATNDLNFEEFVKLMNTLIDQPYDDREVDEAFESLAGGGDDGEAGEDGGATISTDRFRVSQLQRPQTIVQPLSTVETHIISGVCTRKPQTYDPCCSFVVCRNL